MIKLGSAMICVVCDDDELNITHARTNHAHMIYIVNYKPQCLYIRNARRRQVGLANYNLSIHPLMYTPILLLVYECAFKKRVYKAWGKSNANTHVYDRRRDVSDAVIYTTSTYASTMYMRMYTRCCI